MPRLLFVCLAALLVPVMGLAQVEETITVERILIDARVTDAGGDPVLDLGTEDFVVRIGGKRATIESATWIPETEAARAIANLDREDVAIVATGDVPAPAGRLFVFLVQTDFARNSVRVRGSMKFMLYVDSILEILEPEDRVAVLSFDSHLKFRLDFMSEKSRIRAAMESALLIDTPPTPQIVPNPSLARRLDPERMRKATSSEEALVLLGDALKPIPGPKSLLLFGWGLGELVNGRVHMPREYAVARKVLEAARVTIFSLDTTDADAHDLQAGLETAAVQTGGFYAKTHTFPTIAIERLRRTLAGHYELEVRKPAALKSGTHAVSVDVQRRGVHVMARTTFLED